MTETVPSFYKNFKCIAGACSDNCCIGWEIDIDQKTYNDYMHQNNTAFGKKLKSSIAFYGENASFILSKGDRCPFLNSQNLCEIITELGETSICEICTKHPRFYNWYKNSTEIGLGLCCEEVCRLLYSSSNHIGFVTSNAKEINQNSCVDYDEHLYDSLYVSRKHIYKILSSYDISFDQKLFLILELGDKIQTLIDNGGTYSTIKTISEDYAMHQKEKASLKTEQSSSPKIVKSIVRIFSQYEKLDPNWKNALKQISEKAEIIQQHKNEFLNSSKAALQYENLAIYYIYRYYLNAVFDEDVLSKIKFTAVSCYIIQSLDILVWLKNKKSLSLIEKINNTKAYSKELEYSDINLESFFDSSYQADCLSVDNISSLF